ncbi:MAG: helix-turn-helix domain-containing protein [Bacteroidetes bacterium]|nr:helix-turn-helix domain-containing protein [Bacteroidota bacterium]
MKHIDTIKDYCKQINIHPPKHDEFDARTFDENMPTVKRKVEPFKHEFYAIGLLIDGTSHNWHGIPNFEANIIFNSPYQLISWDIENDWSGYYIMFTQDYLNQCHFSNTLLSDFPFLKLDQTIPFKVPLEQIQFLKNKFEQTISEYNSNQTDKFKFIESYVNLILLSIKRFSSDIKPGFFASEQNRNADLRIVSRYQSLIETNINSEAAHPNSFSTSFYADQLNIHPNHLNAIVKRITGSTAKQVIQETIIKTSKSLLLQSNLSIKEIAFKVGYEEAAHFSTFFKKATNLTPVQFRGIANL